ncbi:MAG: adenosylcobinamide-GDP ribazoletransferase [Acidobacteria bacterium]|nr:adenosylcobinamide-GDP ribazoletransferase [Acidobacteriota bacterium]
MSEVRTHGGETQRSLPGRIATDVVVAFQFLTRLPMPAVEFNTGSLARSAQYFPLVGMAVGAGAVLVERLLAAHLERPLVAIATVIYLVAITGCFHEDALADLADSFGAWTRERRLEIMRDSRIGSYGAAALVLALAARVALLTYLPLGRFAAYVIAAHVLCRWSTLPLSYFIPPARVDNGQGAQVAGVTSRTTLAVGSAFTLAVVVGLLRWSAIAPIVLVVLVTAVSGWTYRRRLGGVTGDCFGATNQLSEIAVYLCGVWVL